MEARPSTRSGQAVIGANVLPLVEEHFRFLVDEYGFTLAQTTDIPTGAWYRSPRGAVVVQYDLMRDAALDVGLELKASGDTHSVCEILELSVAGAERRVDVRDPEAFRAELERAKRLLVEHCDDFLRGDAHGFCTRFREALLVKRCRQVAHDEFADGDPRRAVKLLSALRPYWSDRDREYHERALDRCRHAAHERKTDAGRGPALRLLR
jgi:hypothetical protein